MHEIERQVPKLRDKVSRSFLAGEWSDLTADWTLTPQSSFQLVHQNLTTLRSRARSEYRTNDYAKRYVGMLKNGVVGPDGFALQCQFQNPNGEPDAVANRAFEEHFRRWAEDPVAIDVRARLDLKSFCHLLVQQLATDGEYLVRLVQRGPFGLQLQLVDPFLLDVTYNDELRNGNKVRMGIELSPWGRAVAYHFNIAGDYYYNTGERERISAAEVLHGFLDEGVDQYRGIPWLSTPMYRMHMLAGFEEASIINARAGASKMGFLKHRDPERYTGEGGSAGGPVEEIAPGMVGHLGSEDDWVPHNPDYPAGEFEQFVRQMLRGVASGLESSYPGLANDLSGVNYNSLRHDALESRDVYMRIQQWFTAAFLKPLWLEWLDRNLLIGIPIPRAGGGVRMASGARVEKYRRVRWQGRRWQWVDPAKEIAAIEKAIALKITTRAQAIRDRGADPDEVFAEVEDEQERFGAVESGGNAAASSDGEDNDGSDQPGAEDG